MDDLEDPSLSLNDIEKKLYPGLKKWAHRYNGYERFASDHWNELMEPLSIKLHKDREIPGYLGVDFLRAWAFFIARSHNHAHTNDKSYSCCTEMYFIADAVTHHKAAKKTDLPPPIPASLLESAKRGY